MKEVPMTLRQVIGILSAHDSFRIYIGDFDGQPYCTEQPWRTEFHVKDFPEQLLDYEVDYITYDSENYGDCIYMCIILKEG